MGLGFFPSWMIPDSREDSTVNQGQIERKTLQEYFRLKSEYGHISDVNKEVIRVGWHIQGLEKEITALRSASDKNKATLYDLKELARYEAMVNTEEDDE
jgi:hypothetical protein